MRIEDSGRKLESGARTSVLIAVSAVVQLCFALLAGYACGYLVLGILFGSWPLVARSSLPTAGWLVVGGTASPLSSAHWVPIQPVTSLAGIGFGVLLGGSVLLSDSSHPLQTVSGALLSAAALFASTAWPSSNKSKRERDQDSGVSETSP